MTYYLIHGWRTCQTRSSFMVSVLLLSGWCLVSNADYDAISAINAVAAEFSLTTAAPTPPSETESPAP